ncbi:MAG TPA: chemotaxis protein CheB [Candidatus Deferrimicrobiaceae bacterium]
METVRHPRLVPFAKAATGGGLSGVEAFLSRMPPDFRADIALVLVQRLSRDCTNRLAEMISRYFRMSPVEVEDGMQLAHAGAYVVPPGRELTVRDGRAHLRRRATLRGRRVPDSHFFDLFNRETGRRAIGILFSGNGCEAGRKRARSAPAPEIPRIACVVRDGY